MTMEMFIDLPRDLVEEEIVTRVPARHLKGLGSTCKLWNRMFNGDRRFAAKHTDKAAKQFMVLLLRRPFRISPAIVDLGGKVPSLEAKTDVILLDPHPKCRAAQFEVGRVFHCDGLLLCTSADESRFVVWNPFTGETRWFQPSYRHIPDRHFALGYYKQGNNKRYKVLSFYYHCEDFEMYEFGSDSWRVVDVDDIMPPGWRIGYCSIGASLNGSTYWFAQNKTKPQSKSIVSLVRFDFSTEKSVPVPLPYQQPNHFDVTGLSVVKDEKLSVLLQSESRSKIEIWVTNKIETTQVVSWSKVLAFDMRPGLRLFEEGRFLLDEEKKVVMLALNWLDFEDETKSRDMIYIVGEDNEATQVDLGPAITDAYRADILNYFPSLVQIERAGVKRKRGDM